MFKVLTTTDEILNVTFPELVKMADEGKIESYEVSQEVELVSIETLINTNNRYSRKLELVMSKEAHNQMCGGGTNTKYHSVFVSDEDIKAGYCYNYSGYFSEGEWSGYFSEGEGEWEVDCIYPVLNLDLSSRVDSEGFSIETRTPLSDEKIDNLKAQVEALAKSEKDKLIAISMFTYEQKEVLKNQFGFDLFSLETELGDDSYDEY